MQEVKGCWFQALSTLTAFTSMIYLSSEGGVGAGIIATILILVFGFRYGGRIKSNY